MSERFRTLSAVLLMLIRVNDKGQEEILLQKRKNTGWMDGYWDFSATGHVEDQESMKMAMVREAKEELGIDIKMENLEFITMTHTYTEGTEQIYYNGYFKVTKWSGEPKTNEPEKCEEVRWFSINELPENTINNRVVAMQNYKNKVAYSEIGWTKNGG